MTDSTKPIVASPFSFAPYKEKDGEEYLSLIHISEPTRPY